MLQEVRAAPSHAGRQLGRRNWPGVLHHQAAKATGAGDLSAQPARSKGWGHSAHTFSHLQLPFQQVLHRLRINVWAAAGRTRLGSARTKPGGPGIRNCLHLHGLHGTSYDVLRACASFHRAGEQAHPQTCATTPTTTKQGRFVKATAGSIAHGPERSVGTKYPYILLPDLPPPPRNTAAQKIGPPAPHRLQHEWNPRPIFFSIRGGNHQWSVGGSFEVFCMDGAEDEQQRRVPGQLRPEVSVDFQTKFSSFRNFGVVLSFAVSF